MNNQSTALEGGAMPSAHKFNPLTTDAIAVRLGYLRNLGSLGWCSAWAIDYPLNSLNSLNSLNTQVACFIVSKHREMKQ